MQHVVGDLLVVGTRVGAIDAGEIDDGDGAPIRQVGDSGVLLHRDAGEVGHLLAQSGETIEQGSFARVGRTYQHHRAHRRRARHFHYRGTTATMATAAIADGILGFARGVWDLTELSVRTVKRRAVARRAAISEPSAWN